MGRPIRPPKVGLHRRHRVPRSRRRVPHPRRRVPRSERRVPHSRRRLSRAATPCHYDSEQCSFGGSRGSVPHRRAACGSAARAGFHRP
ncbi:MAG: hypothetical protein GEU97_06105 [Actinophytocola sp.]|nr:hypothetical protein [Actinophytocola sp.]